MKSRYMFVTLLSISMTGSVLANHHRHCGDGVHDPIVGTYIGKVEGLENSGYTIAIYGDGGGFITNEISNGAPGVWASGPSANGALSQTSLSWSKNSLLGKTYSILMVQIAGFVPTDGTPLLPTQNQERTILKGNNITINTDCSISGTMTGQTYDPTDLTLSNPKTLVNGNASCNYKCFTVPITGTVRIKP